MRRKSRSWLCDERGFIGTLIEILVVAAIILVLAYYLIGRTNKEGKTVPGAALERGRSVACMSNLRQIRMAISMFKEQNDGQNPGSLSDLSSYGVGPGLTQCPVGKADYPYVYDPATGTVHCRYPGHEKY
jgi:prepilin-type N-terminal cleavage/methylation domain-containing protein